jgi:CRP-like cAMP-binding protein
MAMAKSRSVKSGQIPEILAKSGLFEGLPGTLTAEIAGLTLRKLVGKRQFLFWKGTPVGGIFIVEYGAIALRISNWKGKECMLRVCHPYESFAEEALTSEEGFPADAYALMDSQVLMVRRDGLLYLLKRHPELGLCLLRNADENMRRLLNWLDSLTRNDVPTRLAEWLLQHCPDPDSHRPCAIPLPATKRSLASELGTIPETFSRTLARLQSQGLLEVERKAIILNNPVRLARFCSDQNGAETNPSANGTGRLARRGVCIS